MVAFNNNYFTDYEDNGFGGDAVSQNEALANFIQPAAPAQPAAPVTPAAPSKPLTFADLTKLYNEKGATTARQVQEGEEMKTYYDPTDLGEGWMAWEHPGELTGSEGQGEDVRPTYSTPTLGGFSRKDGDYVNFYDLNGKLVQRQKWNESALKSAWNDVGPVAMAALTMGGGAGALGNALFGLEGAAAAGAGGALGGAFNAGMNDQNILTGALKGGLGSAGALELGDIAGKNITLGDVSKAVNVIQNPTLSNIVGAASDYLPGDMKLGDMKLGDTGISVGDLVKNAGTAAALASGDERQIFNAIVGSAKSGDIPLKTSFGPGDAQEFSDNLIEGYFQPGGEGYAGQEETTVQQEPANVDSFLRELSPYLSDEQTAERTLPVERASDITETTEAPTKIDTDIENILPKLPNLAAGQEDESSVRGNAADMTVREDPENVDSFLRELSPYQSDEEAGKSVFAKDEDIPEFETVAERGAKDIDRIDSDPMDLLKDQYAVAGNGEEMTVREDPENVDSFLRELNPYLSDETPEDRTIPAERESDIKDDEVTPDVLPFDPNDILPTLPDVPVKTTPKTPASTTKPGAPATEKTQGTSPFDLLSLLALMDSGQQAPQIPRKKNSAEIELMQDIFGSTLNFD